MKTSEHDEQATLFQWAELSTARFPELALLFAIPNGGRRHIKVAREMKAEGVKAGVPDIYLPIPRKKYHGLFIEMKVKGGRVRKNQKNWIALLKQQGYKVEVCFGFQEAKTILEEYLA